MKGLNSPVCLVTYCSRDKDHAKDMLPAVLRYRSSRIQVVSRSAEELEVGFFILSGLYGLLAKDHPIPDYDHLLTPAQVSEHAALVARQLDDSGVEKVVFITRPETVDGGVGPYREAMLKACLKVGAVFRIIEMPDPDISPARLVLLVKNVL